VYVTGKYPRLMWKYNYETQFQKRRQKIKILKKQLKKYVLRMYSKVLKKK
jgi:flagellar biosynthesis/type III secretory pathway protein FliH